LGSCIESVIDEYTLAPYPLSHGLMEETESDGFDTVVHKNEEAQKIFNEAISNLEKFLQIRRI
jgi:hypothetical protein